MALLERLGQLGAEFDTIWQSQPKCANFADCAYEFLSTLELPPFSWKEVEGYALRVGNHSDFGDLNILAYQNDHFVIEVLVWESSSPDIHSHSFSGAFRVLLGGSVHASYAIKKVKWSSPGLVLGEVVLKDLSVLRVGDAHVIKPGLEFLHGLYHWHAPSITIVLRTKKDDDHTHQFVLPKPEISLQVIGTGRQVANDGPLHAFRNLIAFRPWIEVERALIEALDELPIWRIWSIFSEVGQRFSPLTRKKVLAALPAPLREMPPTKKHSSILRDARPLLTTDRSRMVAGMLLFAPSRTVLLEAITREFPDEDPITWLSDATSEMFDLLLSDPLATKVSRYIVPDILNGYKIEQVLISLHQSFVATWIEENEQYIRAIYKIILAEVYRFVRTPVF